MLNPFSSPSLPPPSPQARLYMQQFYAMFLKRALYSWRNWKVMVAQFLVPLVFTVLALAVARSFPGHHSAPLLRLVLGRYGPTTVPVALEPGAGQLTAALADTYNLQLSAQQAQLENITGVCNQQIMHNLHKSGSFILYLFILKGETLHVIQSLNMYLSQFEQLVEMKAREFILIPPILSYTSPLSLQTSQTTC